MSSDSYPLTKAVAIATAAYAAYCIVAPRHVADALEETGDAARATDRVAYTYAARDLVKSALAFVPGLAPVAGALRIAGDLGDAVVLGATAPASARAKLIAVPLGWGALTGAALLIDKVRNR